MIFEWAVLLQLSIEEVERRVGKTSRCLCAVLKQGSLEAQTQKFAGVYAIGHPPEIC